MIRRLLITFVYLHKIKNNALAVGVSLAILGLYLVKISSLDSFLKFDQEGQLIWQRFQEFITFFLSIIVEAFPFVVLGVLISVIVGLFFKSEWLLRILPRNRFLNHLLISLFGIFLPVCECGNVPVARRLISKNFTVSQSVTFLLAAPIINPITLWSTLEAFRPDASIAIIRVLSALFVANFVGIVISFHKNQNSLLTDKFYAEVCEVDEHHHSKVEEGIEIFQHEFIEVMKMLCLGAVFAALTQVFVPREIITSLGQSSFLSIVAMMLFAFIISICSNVDAFVVLPYAGTFTLGSIVSFLVFGPMIDMKILTMLRTSFKPKLLLFITLFVALFSVLLGLVVNYFI